MGGDDFFGFLDQGYIAPWTAHAHAQNDIVIGAAAAAAAGGFATGGYCVVYDGVIGPWFLDAFGAGTELDSLYYVVLLPAEATCVERVRARVAHGYVDLDATRHMHRQFAASDVPARHVLDSPGDAREIASHIFDLMQGGNLVWPANHQTWTD